MLQVMSGTLLQLYTFADIHEFIGTCSNGTLHQDQIIWSLGMVVDSYIYIPVALSQDF